MTSITAATERATLGAILLEAARYDELKEWLQPDDFEGLHERATYNAIDTVRIASEDGVTPDAVNAYLLAHPDAVANPADGSFLADCMHQCPSPDRAVYYGRMVLELSIQRTVRRRAEMLGTRARNATTAVELNRVFAGVDSVRRTVEDLHQREARAAGAYSVAPLRSDDLPAIRPAPYLGEPDLERRVVRALIAQPTAIRHVTDWLSDDDFSDVHNRTVFANVVEMYEAKDPIDPVTVTWSLAQAGQVSAIADVMGGPPGTDRDAEAQAETDGMSAVPLAKRLLEVSVRARIIATSDDLERSAIRRPTTTAEAHRRMLDLWPEQRRLITSRRGETT
ncbi:DnaB-like helicase N-terminal domain-containing protein [Mumia qirimensis]|uniref:DnaB-like helicase N-terminal domain-containing protein n=1 Tax=Mumia qirimensis TaxID=3234852 RepID=UPI00351D316B